MIYAVPNIEECKDFAIALGAKYICIVPIQPSDNSLLNCCHYNCKFNHILGYYFAKDKDNILHDFKHSVLNIGDVLVDNTPTIDNRTYNIFCYYSSYYEEHLTYIESSVYINKI